jgi:hypothetical protein
MLGAFVLSALAAERLDVFIESRNIPVIAYDKTPGTDAVAQLQKRLQAGTAKLTYNPTDGYLSSLLDTLKIPRESQMLVFSQTSFQSSYINVKNPRAMYFNEDVSVAWIRGAPHIEISAEDPKEGVNFYTIDNTNPRAPLLARDIQCLACHLSWDTLGVPGMITQSVQPLPDKNAYVIGFPTNHASPFAQRWGGWYVTGSDGRLPHMGNVPVMPEDKGKLALSDPHELQSVKGLFDLKGYQTPYSDVAALLVFNHQTYMTNLITRMGWEARVADAMPSPHAQTRVAAAAHDLVDYMLFIAEEPLPHPVTGASGFAAKFSAQGPFDSKGRGLHQLDLQHRTLKYPCSYMIYSDAFDALPASAKRAVYARLWTVLSGHDTDKRYARLTKADRDAIIQILRETKKDLPDEFRG